MKKGDIVYQTLGDEIDIYFEDIQETYSRVNIIGNLRNIEEDIENILSKIFMSVKLTVKLS